MQENTRQIRPKRLIEVSMPLAEINAASAYEKKVKVGKPTSVHHWFAPRTLTAARAILFGQLVSDPGDSQLWTEEKTSDQVRKEREALFDIIRELISWESYSDTSILSRAYHRILSDWTYLQELNGTSEPLPSFLDPFCGRGTIPLEAQSLGLEVHASDLNPIPVLINKCILEYPKQFAHSPPVSCREWLDGNIDGGNASGLATDILAFGKAVLNEARRRASSFYPEAAVDGGRLPVVSWLWARTVESPNPAFSGCMVPLISSFALSAKAKQKYVLKPVISGSKWDFEIQPCKSIPRGSGTVSRSGARCLLSDTHIPLEYVREEARAGRLGKRLIAIVADSSAGRVYLPADQTHEEAADQNFPVSRQLDDIPIEHWPGCTNCVIYGYETFLSLYTDRQKFALTTLSDCIKEHQAIIKQRASEAGHKHPDEYAAAITTYLALALSRTADWNNAFSRWEPKAQVPQQLYGRHSISMCWDYAEANPFHDATGSYIASVKNICRALSRNLIAEHIKSAEVELDDATEPRSGFSPIVVSADPPYYDNIPYSNLSDLFYLWLRDVLKAIHPGLFATIETPKRAELVANRFRHGSEEAANAFFSNGIRRCVSQLARRADASFPMTLYYAFKQKEGGEEGEVSTGWETFLQGLVDGGLQITGTWPIRSEMTVALKGKWNALASSIVVVLRTRGGTEQVARRRDFLEALQRELPHAVTDLQQGNVAPVDLAQASIGPGMAVFTRYAKVIEADGTAMTVRTALALINQTLDEVLAEQEGEFEADTRWALAWFEEYGVDEGPYGTAETLSKAKNTAVNGLVDAGLIVARSGKVRLVRRDELNAAWDPTTDNRLTTWEVTQHLIRVLETEGEAAAAQLVRKLDGTAEAARELAYRLYSICERKKWADEALAYNGLVIAWPELFKLSLAESSRSEESQQDLFTTSE